jgi:predicted PolB exonuclease-like 3'-5' exonuclease
MMNVLCFDIETIPDTDFGRKLFDLGDLDDETVAKVMRFKQMQARQTDFLPLPQHRIVVISAVLRDSDGLHIFSLGQEQGDEAEIVQRFFDGLERRSPDLVSWNGSGFDLPVLHYRALLHGVTAARYWEIGDTDRDYRYNNYLSRFHWRHMDLMDVLSGFQFGGRASLQHTSVLLGLPGKLGMSGADVWDYYRDGKYDEVQRYCETDAVNTYLIYLRFELMRGVLDQARYEQEVQRVRDKIERSDEPHWKEFSAAWQADGDAG